MIYARARYLDPKTGRFLSEDPIASANRYGYADNNPLSLWDPYGLMALEDGQVRKIGEASEAALKEIGEEIACSMLEGAAASVLAQPVGTIVSTAACAAMGSSRPPKGPKGPGSKIPNDDLLAPPPARGRPPVGSDGSPVELHHRGQNPDSPLDELTRTEHRGKGNFKGNHQNTGQEPSKIDRKKWKKEREDYWKNEWDDGRFDDMR